MAEKKKTTNLWLTILDVAVGNDEDKTLGINYSELIPVPIKNIQEQKAYIYDFKKQVIELQNKYLNVKK